MAPFILLLQQASNLMLAIHLILAILTLLPLVQPHPIALQPDLAPQVLPPSPGQSWAQVGTVNTIIRGYHNENPGDMQRMVLAGGALQSYTVPRPYAGSFLTGGWLW